MNLLPLGLDGVTPKFTVRPEPLPADFRRSWRVAVLLLALRGSWGNRASREKLLVLNYALRNPSVQETLVEVLKGEQSPFFLQLRVDPALGRALDFAEGVGLIEMLRRGRVKLTPTGEELADQILSTEGVLEEEMAFLEAVRRLASERRINEVLNWR